MACSKKSLVLILLGGLMLSGCFRYSFTGTSIPDDVNTVFIPFFADQSSSSIGNLSDRLNQALVDRFINQTRLRLANSQAGADAVLEGSIVNYANEPFSISGDQQTTSNEVTISVRATFKYTNKEQAEWSKTFSGSDDYDTNENPIEGENTAAENALDQIANDMFNDAVSGW